MIRDLLDIVRRWLRLAPVDRRDFDEILRDACDEPLMVVSAQAMLRSISSSSECDNDFNCDVRRNREALRFQRHSSTAKTR